MKASRLLILLLTLILSLALVGVALATSSGNQTPKTPEEGSAADPSGFSGFTGDENASSSSPKISIDDDVRRLEAATGGDVEISLNKATGVASFVRLVNGASLSFNQVASSPEAQASAFFAAYGGLFGVTNPAEELVLVGTEVDYLGNSHVTYKQVYAGVDVWAAILKAHMDQSAAITSVNGVFIPNVDLNTTPSLSAAEAEAIAVETVQNQAILAGQGANSDLAAASSHLYVFRAGLVARTEGRNHLVYEVEVTDPDITIREFVYVDAHTGKVVDQIHGITDVLTRQISETSLANVVWVEGNPDPIPAGWAGGTVQQVTDWQNEIDGAAESYYLFGSMTGAIYLSYDGSSATMRTVNNDPGISCPNANWNGTSTNYCSGTTADDVVAHEWGHAYTEYTNNLIYQWQSGALNESYSDIWGETVDLLNGRGSDAPGGLRSTGACSTLGSGTPSTDNTYRWLMGEDATAFSGAIRDMWNPTCYSDPGRVSDTQYQCSVADSGGVHSNSGVPNHAFALLVDGGVYNGQTITATGLTKAAHLHWAAQNMLTPASNFGDHADALEAACQSLLTAGTNLNALSTITETAGLSGEFITSEDCETVSAAITAVQFRTEPTQCNFQPMLDPNAPAFCSGGTVDPIASQDWESGLGSWTAGTRNIANPSSFSTPDWAVVGSLPGSRSGSAAFVEDGNRGACTPSDTEAGVLYVESPDILIPGTVSVPYVAFDHWVATELGWDGGNLKINVNGGGWTVVPGSAYTFNAYPGSLVGGGNDNPMAGEAAFTGTDGGSAGGSWGQSQVNLNGIAAGGDTVRLRFEMGLDGCNGVIGWYVDDVDVYACGAPPEPLIEVDPSAMASIQATNTNITQTLTVSNVGTADLDWEVFEDDSPGLLPLTSNYIAPAATAAGLVTIGDLAFSTNSAAVPLASVPGLIPSISTGGGNVTITHSASQNLVSGNSVSCNLVGLHADNSYLRRFTLSDFGILGTFDVTQVEIGIEVATAGSGGSQPATLNLYTWDPSDPFTFVNLTLIGTTPVTVSNQSLSILTMPINANVPAGSTLVVEFFTPDGQSAGNSLFVGSNALGQTDGTYLAAADCGATEPTDTAALSFPNMHLVMNVTGIAGDATCDAADSIPWIASVDPITGTTAAGGSSPVDVLFDSTGMAAGTYTSTLCVTSNDTITPRVAVPLTMTVAASPSYGVDLSPVSMAEGAAGSTVNHTVYVTNTGNVADVYDLVISGETWTSTLPSSSVVVNPGEMKPFSVLVDIPSGAAFGANDTATITATSQGNNSLSDTSQATTTSTGGGRIVYLPMIFKTYD